jgi:hypothetical protein
MFNEDDVRTLVADMRSLADQIEQKGQAPKVVQTKDDNSEGPADIAPV